MIIYFHMLIKLRLMKLSIGLSIDWLVDEHSICVYEQSD